MWSYYDVLRASCSGPTLAGNLYSLGVGNMTALDAGFEESLGCWTGFASSER